MIRCQLDLSKNDASVCVRCLGENSVPEEREMFITLNKHPLGKSIYSAPLGQLWYREISKSER